LQAKSGIIYEVREAEFVVRNKFITTASCKKLLELPGLKEIFLREKKELNLQRSANVEAVLAQSRGETEVEECKGCGEGGGPFTNCVTMEGMLQGSCTNCHFGSRGAKCSFRPKPSAKRVAREANLESEEEEDYGRNVRGRKRRNISLQERFRNVGTLMGYLAEEFKQIAEALE
jgi:hypothetical protein